MSIRNLLNPKSFINRSFAVVLVSSLAAPALSAPRDPATPEQLARHARRSLEANRPWAHWAKGVVREEQIRNRESGWPSDLYFKTQKVYKPVWTQEQLEIAEDTQKAIDELKPAKTGTFGESANLMVQTKNGDYRWDELGLSGLNDPQNVKDLLDLSLKNEITDIRIGLNLAEIDVNRPETMNRFINTYLVPMWERGMFPIVVLDWFANMEVLETKNADGSTNHERSFLNNPRYVDHREKLADMASKKIFAAMDAFDTENAKKPAAARVRPSRIAFNNINETHTKAAFERHFWHRAKFSGVTWGSHDLQRLYIPGVIHIGRAAVRMRAAVERNRKGRTVLFIHNEAMTPAYYPTHDGYLQFAVSRMVMGDAVFTDADYAALAKEPLDQLRVRLDQTEQHRKAQGENLTELEGMLKLFVFGSWNDTPQKREAARAELVKMLAGYQNDVRKLKSEFKLTMRHRTIFMADYYQQSEFVSPKPVPELARDLAKNQGEGLKRALELDDQKLVDRLRDAARTAEARTGVKIWGGWNHRAEIDFDRLLTVEDAIMMDLLIGFRYANWSKRSEPDLVQRQQRVGLDKSLDAFEKAKGDEYRADEFLNDLLKDDAKKLRMALDVKNDVELVQALEKAAKDTRDGGRVLSISNAESIRDILNKDSRRILMRLFGLKAERFIGFLPPHYPIQINAGIREGFFPIFVRYAKVMGVAHVGIGESGTPYYPWAERVHTQMAMSASFAARLGFTFVSYHRGPWVNTIGWSPGPLDGDLKTNGAINESGIFKFEKKANGRFEYSLMNWPGKEPWDTLFSRPLHEALRASEASQPKRTPETSNGVVSRVRSTPKSCKAAFG